MSLSINVYTAYHVLETFPNSGDEYAYKYASDIMLEGRVTLEATEKQSLLHPFGFKQIDGKLVSKFPPGWPAVLTFFRALGVPVNLVNPILSLLCLILVCANARELQNALQVLQEPVQDHVRFVPSIVLPQQISVRVRGMYFVVLRVRGWVLNV